MTRGTAAVGVLLWLGVGCTGPPPPDAGGPSIRFVEVTAESGVAFHHVSGRSGRKFMVETFGGGVCLLDHDGDGDLDIYLVNSADLPGHQSERPPRNALYRNDGAWHFTDVTAAAAVGDGGYGMGCTAADYDNDGDTDLYVTNFGPNRLYRNDAGRFVDVTDAAGVGDAAWGTSAAFADYDGDGHLDLFVANYLDYGLDRHKYCGNYRRGYQSYCPDAYEPAADVLYRNRGDGTFMEVGAAAGVRDTTGKGLGVVWGDVDNDGDLDLYVANDITPNFLYRNDGDGTFTDVALAAGVAFGEDGEVQAGMGTDFGDYDNDGDLDLFVTNFDSETNALYRNDGDGMFSDRSFFSGLGEISLRFLGFGTNFADFDNDGDLDLFVNNGHILDDIEEHHDSITYAEPNLLFENLGTGRFREIGAGFGGARVGRGSASGDLDDDGDIDLVVVNLDDTAQLFDNRSAAAGWLRLRLIGVYGNRDAIGARVTVTAGDRSAIAEVRSASSYLSQNDSRLHFGLGGNRRVDRVQVRWPGGQVEQFRDIPADTYLVIEAGRGIVDPEGPEER